MSSFIIDVPMPSMGATVSELTLVKIVAAVGDTVAKGQKIAELESDKSAFDFEAPAAGRILEIRGAAGQVKRSGDTLFRMETADASLQHLAIATAQHEAAAPAPAVAAAAPMSAKALVWTPRALKVAQEAGLDPAKVTDIAATGPGGRVSGDDVVAYLASRR